MIAVFAGNGNFPIEILSSLKKSKKKFIVLNLSNKTIKGSHKTQLGQFGKILSLLKKNNIKEVIFAGKVSRPKLSDLKLDLKAISYLPQLREAFRKGDGNLLNFCKKILHHNKIKVVESHKYSKELLLNKTATNTKPSKENILDFKKGKKVLSVLGKFDNAQGIVIDNGYILAVEAAEGTDMMLYRVLKLKGKDKKRSGVLIKLPKSNQNLRYDLPTIGLKTVQKCIKANLKGIFLKKNQNIFLNKNKSVELANKYNFFITAI